MSQENKTLIDYTQGIFRRDYIDVDCKYYFIVAPEFFGEEDGLENTGALIVLLVHPTLGSMTFRMVLEEDGRFVPEEPHTRELVGPKILHLICNAIYSHHA